MKIVTYLNFAGQCEAAFKAYEKILGAKIAALRTYGDSPLRDHVAADFHEKVLHAQLDLGPYSLMASDVPPGRFNKSQGFAVSLLIDDEFESERVFAALAEGGEVRMALAPTFWASRFGECVDKYGIPWTISGGAPRT